MLRDKCPTGKMSGRILSGLHQRLQYCLLFWDRVLARHLPGLEPGGEVSFRRPASPTAPWQPWPCCSAVWKHISANPQQNRPLPPGLHTSTPKLLLSPGEPQSFSLTGLLPRLEAVLTHSSRHRGTCQLPLSPWLMTPGPSQTHRCPP